MHRPGLRPWRGAAALVGLTLAVFLLTRGALVDEVAPDRCAPRPTRVAAPDHRLVAPSAPETTGGAAAGPGHEGVAAVETRWSIRGVVTLDDVPWSGAALRFIRPDEEPARARTARSAADGTFSVDLTSGRWAVAVSLEGVDDLALAVAWLDDLTTPPDDGAWGQGSVTLWCDPPGRLLDGMVRTWVVQARPEGFLHVRGISPRTLRGQVVDLRRHAPIAGAEVSIVTRWGDRPGERRATRTDAAGAYELRVPRRGEFATEVVVEAEGYGAMATRPSEAPVEFALRPALLLEGRVVDLEGRPVAAIVDVEASLPDPTIPYAIHDHTWSVPCDPDGRFRVAGVPAGAGHLGPNAASVRIHARSPEHVDGFFGVELPAARPLTLRVARALTLRGRVVDADGRPVSGAEVTSVGVREEGVEDDGPLHATGDFLHPAHTDEGGAFTLERAPERGFLEVEAPGAPLAVFEVFASGAPDEEVELVLERAGRIAGRAVRFDGRPTRAHVTARGHGAPEHEVLELELTGPGVRRVDRARAGGKLAFARAEADGRFVLEGLPSGGVYDLHAFAGSTATATPGPQAERVAVGAEGVELVVDRPGGRVLVEVLAADPLEGYEVVVRDADARVVRSVDHGARTRPGDESLYLPEGRVSVEARARGFRPVARWCDVRAGQAQRLEPLRLERGGGSIHLHVTWPPGPAPVLRAAYRDPQSGVDVVTWLGAPSLLGAPCVLEPVGAGVVTLQLTAQAGARARALPPITVRIVDGGVASARVSLAPE